MSNPEKEIEEGSIAVRKTLEKNGVTRAEIDKKIKMALVFYRVYLNKPPFRKANGTLPVAKFKHYTFTQIMFTDGNLRGNPRAMAAIMKQEEAKMKAGTTAAAPKHKRKSTDEDEDEDEDEPPADTNPKKKARSARNSLLSALGYSESSKALVPVSSPNFGKNEHKDPFLASLEQDLKKMITQEFAKAANAFVNKALMHVEHKMNQEKKDMKEELKKEIRDKVQNALV